MNTQTYFKAKSLARFTRPTAVLALATVLAGCAGMADKPAPADTADVQPCQVAAQGEAWLGNWLGVNKRKGVAGELHVQVILQQDGTMAYTEQLKRAGKSPQSLNETGCWYRDDQTLVMKTTHSNGVAVEQDDPIYSNHYRVRTQGNNLVLEGPEGPLTLRRMPGDYRLPMF